MKINLKSAVVAFAVAVAFAGLLVVMEVIVLNKGQTLWAGPEIAVAARTETSWFFWTTDIPAVMKPAESRFLDTLVLLMGIGVIAYTVFFVMAACTNEVVKAVRKDATEEEPAVVESKTQRVHVNQPAGSEKEIVLDAKTRQPIGAH